ncbi:MAG TPA: hypothetical protein VEB67_01075, partial [Nitrososphaerales archaeon]|nr:hypothetical protein [Nitrososphaerales archaeon]
MDSPPPWARGRGYSIVPEGWVLRCVNCGHILDTDPKSFTCPECGEILELAKKDAVSRGALFPAGGELK